MDDSFKHRLHENNKDIILIEYIASIAALYMRHNTYNQNNLCFTSQNI